MLREIAIVFVHCFTWLECGKPLVVFSSHPHIPLDSDFRSLPLPGFDRPISRSPWNLAVEFPFSWSVFLWGPFQSFTLSYRTLHLAYLP